MNNMFEYIYKVSELGRHRKEFLCDYLIYWIKNPDVSSKFAKRTKLFRWLPRNVLIFLVCNLRFMRYDGLIFCDKNNNVIGHVFYQEHRHEWRGFSIHLSPEFKSNGNKQSYICCQRMIAEFILEAHRNKDVHTIKLGSGGSPFSKRIWEKAINNELELPFILMSGEEVGSIKFNIK